MSYIEVKTIKGNDYAYLRESIRIGKRVIHKNIRYLGRMDALGKSVSELEREIKPVTRIPIKETIPRIKKVRRIKFKLPKRIRQLPIGLSAREMAIEEFKKKKMIKKKIKKLKKKIKKEISEDETKMLFTFI